MRGRKPTPTAKRRLDGNPGRRRLNDAEPVPPPVTETDTVPAELAGNVRAIAEWRRLVPMLHLAKQATEADRSVLLALCLEWSRYLTAMARVAKKGMVMTTPNGYPMVNPYVSIATKALAACAKLWPELGLTPSSRTRLRTDGPGPGGDAFSEFDEAPTTTVRH